MTGRPFVVSPDRLHRLARAAGLVAAGIGALVLVGWTLDAPLLKSVVAGFVTMKANAALAFVLAGAALASVAGAGKGSEEEGPRGPGTIRIVAGASAAAAAGIGLLTLAEYLLGWSPGIDTLLWHDPPGAPGTTHPGRMSPSAALGFVLSGCSLLILNRRREPSVSQALGAAALLVALVGAIEYVFGVGSMIELAGASRISLHAVVGFSVLGAGILLVRAEEGWASILVEDDMGGAALRQLLPAAVLLPVVLGILVRFGDVAGLYPPNFTLPVFVGAVVVVSSALVWLHGLSLRSTETKRIRAEAAFHESEQRKAAVLDAALDCVVTADHRGRILDFNPAAERTFGRSREEVVGREISEMIIPERLRKRHRRGLVRYLETGEATVLGRRIEMPALHADGHEFPVELAINAIRIGGEPVFTAYLRDITERRESEERLRASLAEKDVLLREVHHRVKNNLQVISSLMNLEARRLGPGVSGEAFERTVQRVRAIALLHERLYRADDVAKIDFGSYLERVAETVRRAVRPDAPVVETEVEGSAWPDEVDWAVPCGLIVNELVENALDHGRDEAGRPPRVRLEIRKGGRELRIRVEDDGPGFPVDGSGDSDDVLGLTLVSALARQLRGRVERGRSESLGGARIEVVFPLDGRDQHAPSGDAPEDPEEGGRHR